MAKVVTFVERIVAMFPINAKILAITNTWSLPIISAIIPRVRLPITDPMKNTDWPSAGFQSSLQTQFN